MPTDAILDLRDSSPSAGALVAEVVLEEPQPRLRVMLPPGSPGRAEARFGTHNWAAKHYWPEQPDVTVYEFDESLPAGAITLRIPLAAR
jgi:hypothetical protein